MKVLSRALCALALILGGLHVAHAGIQINGTRVIYRADQREVSLSMLNNGKEARLVQAWVDAGDARERPETSRAPFMITPPMSRVDPGKGQTLRIIFSGADLPQDRESLFWLNVLEIPPKPKAGADGDVNFMQFAVRSRLKIFFRPKGLPGSPEASVDQLSWRLIAEAGGYAVECTNNSSYNVSFSDVSFKNAKPDNIVSKGGMCPAKNKANFAMVGSPDGAEGKLDLTWINDFGGFVPHEASFSH